MLSGVRVAGWLRWLEHAGCGADWVYTNVGLRECRLGWIDECCNWCEADAGDKVFGQPLRYTDGKGDACLWK